MVHSPVRLTTKQWLTRKKTSIADMVVLTLVHKIREDMPLIGTREVVLSA